MAKAKIKVQKSELSFLKKAADFNGVSFDEKEHVIEMGGLCSVEVNTKDVASLFETGRTLGQLLNVQPSK